MIGGRSKAKTKGHKGPQSILLRIVGLQVPFVDASGFVHQMGIFKPKVETRSAACGKMHWAFSKRGETNSKRADAAHYCIFGDRLGDPTMSDS